MIRKGNYVYLDHLLYYDSCKPTEDTSRLIISSEIHSPLSSGKWAQELLGHPDSTYVDYIVKGIDKGFRIGFDRRQFTCSAGGNLHVDQPKVVSDYLPREVALGRMWKVPLTGLPSGVHISPLGVIPKKNKPGKWRLIVDLSSPQGASVNDGIDSEVSSLSYASLDHLAALVVSEGRGAFLVKADIKEAYRMVPVHPEDQHLLGVLWEGIVYIDKMLPFGLRSAPKIFSALADAVQWILSNNGIQKGLHYLDDFILVARNLQLALRQKEALLAVFRNLDIPIEVSKLEGPSTCLTFLGIEVDTVSFQLRLPKDKLASLKDSLSGMVERRTITKKDLQRLTGLLQFATRVVRPGRPFLRRLYAMQDIGSHPNHFIRLNLPARADIMWWHIFMEEWNGVSLLWDLGLQAPDIQVYTDASGNWGCRVFLDPKWFHLEWSSRLRPLSIAVKEMCPVVLAAATFGQGWKGKVVQFVVDNEAVVEVIKATYSKELHLMHLIRLLVFFACKYHFWFTASHIQGRHNIIADALSRNNLSVFYSQAPQAEAQPTQFSQALVSLLEQDITWTSKNWIRLFRNTLQQV